MMLTRDEVGAARAKGARCTVWGRHTPQQWSVSTLSGTRERTVYRPRTGGRTGLLLCWRYFGRKVLLQLWIWRVRIGSQFTRESRHVRASRVRSGPSRALVSHPLKP
eukprot:5888527-Prymnesium_polylepis.1